MKISKNILPIFENERKYYFYDEADAYIDAALYWVYKKESIKEMVLNLFFNSSLIAFWKELLCRPPEGLGVLQMKVYHYNEMPVLPVDKLKIQNLNIREIIFKFAKRKFRLSSPSLALIELN